MIIRMRPPVFTRIFLEGYSDNKEEGTSRPYTNPPRGYGDYKEEGASRLYVDSLILGRCCGGRGSLVLR